MRIEFLAAIAENWTSWPDFVSDPWEVAENAWGGAAGMMVAVLLFSAVGLVYVKTRSVAPTIVLLIAGCATLGALLPPNAAVQRMLYLIAALGVTAMLYRAFIAWRG